jgi:hypothetical protein
MNIATIYRQILDSFAKYVYNFLNTPTHWLDEEIIMPANTAQTAPDFTLDSYTGRSITLSDYQDRRNVVLVFNRGFM